MRARTGMLGGMVFAISLSLGCSPEQEPTHSQDGSSLESEPDPVVRELSIKTDDVTLYARSVGGPGSLIVGLHGGPGLSSHYLEPMPYMPGRFVAGPKRAFVTYDQRGGGRSSKPKSNDYSFARHVEDLEALRVFLEADKLHLLGHSYGAVISMAYAIAHPERVGSLVLLAGAPPTSEELSAGRARVDARVAELQRAGEIQDPLPSPDIENDNMNEMVAASVAAYFSDPVFTPPTEFGAMNYPLSVLEASLAAQMPYDLTSQLGALELPVLILWGEDDPFGVEWARSTEAAFPSADVRLVVLPQCGHFFHECWDQVRAELEPFLDAVAGHRD